VIARRAQLFPAPRKPDQSSQDDAGTVGFKVPGTLLCEYL